MFTHWIQPLNDGQWSALSGPDYPFSQQLSQESYASSIGPKIALIGLDGPSSWQIRTQLYRFSALQRSKAIQVWDLGDFRKSEADFLIPAVKALIEENITPVLFGGIKSMKYSLFHVFQQLNHEFNGLFLDESIKGEDKCLQQVISGDFPKCSAVLAMGWQKHVSDLDTIKQLASKGWDSKRLGELRSDFEDVEPLLRVTHFVDFNIRAMEMSHAPAQIGISSSGLTGSEACQIMRYAGFNTGIKSLAVSGLDVTKDPGLRTANLVAQMLWYFLDGRMSGLEESQSMTEYVVALKDYPLHLSFYKQEQTGRWWVDVPTDLNNGSKRYPCTYKDYKIACQDKISERILRIVNHLL